MTTLTFESVHYSPRKTAVRRAARPVARAVAAPQQPVNTAIRPARSVGTRNRAGIAALLGLTLAAHVGIIVALHQPADFAPLPQKTEPLSIELAPPPPPPPEPPKVQPQVAKAVPTPVKAAPPLPVVSPAAVDNDPTATNTVQVATAPTPAPAPVVAAPPPPPEPVTEPRGYIGYRNNPPPEYPAIAQDRGLQGRVILKVQVLLSGKPGTISVEKTSGHKILDDDAIKTVRGWSFEPARRGQTPIDGWVSVPLNYKLS